MIPTFVFSVILIILLALIYLSCFFINFDFGGFSPPDRTSVLDQWWLLMNKINHYFNLRVKWRLSSHQSSLDYLYETEAAKWNSAIVLLVIHTCDLPAVNFFGDQVCIFGAHRFSTGLVFSKVQLQWFWPRRWRQDQLLVYWPPSVGGSSWATVWYECKRPACSSSRSRFPSWSRRPASTRTSPRRPEGRRCRPDDGRKQTGETFFEGRVSLSTSPILQSLNSDLSSLLLSEFTSAHDSFRLTKR